jgi:hypothetical protein
MTPEEIKEIREYISEISKTRNLRTVNKFAGYAYGIMPELLDNLEATQKRIDAMEIAIKSRHGNNTFACYCCENNKFSEVCAKCYAFSLWQFDDFTFDRERWARRNEE